MTTKRMAPEKRQKCTAWHMQPRLESAWTSHQRAPYTGYQEGLLIWAGTKHTIKTKICMSPSPRILNDFIEAFSKMIVQWADNAELAFIICFISVCKTPQESLLRDSPERTSAHCPQNTVTLQITANGTQKFSCPESVLWVSLFIWTYQLLFPSCNIFFFLFYHETEPRQ